MKLDISVFF